MWRTAHGFVGSALPSGAAVLLWVAGLSGCGGAAVEAEAQSAAQPAPVRAMPPPEKEPAPLVPQSWQRIPPREVALQSRGLAVTLPDPRGWTWGKKGAEGTVARYKQTGALFTLRTWRAGRQVRIQDCAQEASRFPSSAIPPEEGPLVADERLESQHAVRGRILVWVYDVADATNDGKTAGVAQLFAAWPGRCMSAEFRSPPGTAEATAEQLSWFSERVFPSVRRTSVDRRVRREPLP